MAKIKKLNFLSELYERNYISEHYSSLNFAFNTNYMYKSIDDSSHLKNEDFILNNIIGFPTFLTPEFHNKKQITVKRVIQYGLDGYGINIEKKLIDVESYLKESFSHSFRSNIKRLNKRLDTCFSTSYKMYFGYIEKNNYDYLIDSLFEMQVKRLNQKKTINNLKSDYDNYKNIVFDLINTSKASFFVIYNKSEPIGMTLNFHLNNTFFGKVIAYNTNYSKFGIGNILIYKQLDWCIKNKYEFLDMGNGAFDYKRRWCNYHYQLETHIISSKRSLKAFAFSTFSVLFIKLKNVLKRMNFNGFYIISSKNKNSKAAPSLSKKLYILESISTPPPINDIIEINIESSEYNHLKKTVFDFLYSSQDHIDNVLVYKEKENTYIFKGKKKTAKCLVQNIAKH